MPWGVAASVAGTVISSAMAPSSGSGSGSQYYTPTGLGTADTQWQGLQTGNYNTYNQLYPSIQTAATNSFNGGNTANNIYQGGYQSGANNAGAQYGNLANQQTYQSGQAFNNAGNLLSAGQQTYQTALDPQNALYNRTVQQLQDQTGATNSMYGLGSSAAGAGVANQALGNFNIDWQNNQLARQTQGLSAYDSAAQAAAGLNTNASALGTAGAGNYLAAGQTPYSTAQTIAGVPGQLGSTYANQLNTGVYGPAQGIQGQAIPYMNYGQGAQSVPYQNQVAGAGAAGALASQGINSLGSNPQVQSAIGGLFGGGGSGYGGGVGAGYGGYGGFGGGTSTPYYSGGGNSYGFTM
jgi:hypothetical protein